MIGVVSAEAERISSRLKGARQMRPCWRVAPEGIVTGQRPRYFPIGNVRILEAFGQFGRAGG